MPNTASSAKRLRQNETLRIRNRATRSNMRTAIRNFRDAVAANDMEKAQSDFRIATKKLDRAAAKNIIHRNAAARTKSRLNALLKAAATA